MQQSETDFEAVKAVLVEVLGLEDRAHALEATTALVGAMPEFDSMAVMELLLALERHFDIAVDDEDISADTFETLGSLTAFVGQKRACV